jgi:hypothetical protein
MREIASESPLMSHRGGGGVNRRFLNLTKLAMKLELQNQIVRFGKPDTPILSELSIKLIQNTSRHFINKNKL